MSTRQRGIIVSNDGVGMRLDKYLADMFPEHSRSIWARRIDDGQVLVDGVVRTNSYKLKAGDPITIVDEEAPEQHLELPIVYEDEHVIVVDKPRGILTHSKGGLNHEATVASVLADKIDDGDSPRPGIVHRLDRDTSGIIVIAKSTSDRLYMQKQFANRSVKKIYHAIVERVPKDPEGIIKLPIERNPKKPSTFRVGPQGKPSETHYKVIKTGDGRSLVELRPKTGRTHQLRVHLKALGHPIVGDRIYGKSAKRLYLHASELEISIAHDKAKLFKSALPQEFYDVLAA